MHPLPTHHHLQLLPTINLFNTASTLPTTPFSLSLSPASICEPLISNIALPFPQNDTIADPRSFLNTVLLAVFTTTAKYPSATFRFVNATLLTKPTQCSSTITAVRIVFSLAENTTYKSIHVDMTNLWSYWLPPVFSTDEVPDEMGNMPMDVGLPLKEAWQLLWNAGFRETYGGVMLYWPSLPPAPKRQQPFYRFQINGTIGGYVYVGTETKIVTKTLAVLSVAG